ncbi:MAG: DUF2059 domain-containing protein [Gemmatimonadota bacterium]|nr:DUF2059 domain-containing protein [Gemmatimonadota bacterium]
MKRLLTVFVVLAMLTMASGAAHAQGIPPATASQIQGAEHLLVVMDAKRLLESTIESSIQTQLKQMPQLAQVQDVLRNFMAQYMSYESLKPDLVSMYAHAFTEQELRDMAAFYETPLGHVVLTKLPEISAKGAALGQQRVQEHLPELIEAVQARMQQLASDSAKVQQAPKPGSAPKPKPTKPT